MPSFITHKQRQYTKYSKLGLSFYSVVMSTTNYYDIMSNTNYYLGFNITQSDYLKHYPDLVC